MGAYVFATKYSLYCRSFPASCLYFPCYYDNTRCIFYEVCQASFVVLLRVFLNPHYDYIVLHGALFNIFGVHMLALHLNKVDLLKHLVQKMEFNCNVWLKSVGFK